MKIPFLPLLSRGIGWRIFISFTILMVVLTSTVSFLGLQVTQRNINENAANELRLLSVILSRQVQRQIGRIEDHLVTMEKEDAFVAELHKTNPDGDALELYLRAQLAALPIFTDFAVFNKQGICIASTDAGWYDFSVHKKTFFIAGLKGFNLSDIYTPADGRIQLVSLPIMIGSTVRGVLMGQVNLTSIYELMDQKLGVSDTTEAFLVDGRLRFITPGKKVSDEHQAEGSHLRATTLMKHMRDEFWVDRYKNFEGQEVLGTVLKIPGRDWYVVVERDISEIIMPVSNVKKLIFGITVAVILALIVTTFILTRSITKPLDQLVEGTQRIAKGDFKHPIAIPRGGDEVSFLAAEIEKMRAKISAFQESLMERLEESERKRIESEHLAAIGTLASTLAHEIRNPLNAMSLLLSRLELAKSVSDTAVDVVRDLRGEIARLDRLVSDILDYARPVKLQYSRVDLRQLIEGTLEIYRGYFDDRNIRCHLHISSRPIYLHADHDKLRQCFVNLLQNALDAVGSGGLIDINVVAEDTQVEIVLSDDGIGLPAAAGDRLFDLFFTTKEKGTGLGLSTVKKIVDAHGGRISIGPRPAPAENGAAVRIIFPLDTPSYSQI